LGFRRDGMAQEDVRDVLRDGTALEVRRIVDRHYDLEGIVAVCVTRRTAGRETRLGRR
jgi:hypothetical protein